MCGACKLAINTPNWVDEDPPLHIHCARAAGRWVPAREPRIDSMLRMLKQSGWCWSAPGLDPATTHSEHLATHAYWDLPGRNPPGWIVVSQTPCPGPDEELYPWIPVRAFLCQHKHAHRRRREEPS